MVAQYTSQFIFLYFLYTNDTITAGSDAKLKVHKNKALLKQS